MIPSGIAPLDDRLGGLVPRRTYVLTGAPGTGKTIACLQFLGAAFDAGESAVLLTTDDPTDLIAQGQYLGIDLERRLAEERLVLLRFQLDFTRRFARAPAPEIAFDELRQLVGDGRPTRVVIDSLAPFLEASTASGASIRALVAFLDSLGATSLVTYAADLAGLYDRRLEPLVQRAAAIVHFTCDRDRGNRMELRKVRFAVQSTAPASFTIEAGAGIVGVDSSQRRRSGDISAENARKILVIDTDRTLPDDVLAALRTRFDVSVRSTVASAFGELAAAVGAVLLEVRRDTVNDALTLVRELRRAGSSAPIVLCTRFTLRADDRARALRAGADEFIVGDLHPSEMIARLQTTIARGHPAGAQSDVEVPLVVQPSADGGGYELLDGHAFRNAITAHMAGDPVPFFTIVSLRPTDAGSALGLGEMMLRRLRLQSGDLAGYLGTGVAIYLHSARRKDVDAFAERVREEWRRAGNGELDVVVASYPTEEERIVDLLAAEPAEPALELVPNDRGAAVAPGLADAGDDRIAPLLLMDPQESEVDAPDVAHARRLRLEKP